VLVKNKLGSESSHEFWRSQGYTTDALSLSEGASYVSMVHKFSDYSNFICCTFSSVAVMAAALGRPVEFVRDYSYVAYEVDDYLQVVNVNAPSAKELVRTFVSESPDMATQHALELLGDSIKESKSAMKLALGEKLADVGHRLHSPYGRMTTKIMGELALLTNKPGLLKHRGGRKRLGRKKVNIMSVNELDMWMTGPTEENFNLELVEYVPGVTEPGDAVVKY
jgi:hypothetical protein